MLLTQIWKLVQQANLDEEALNVVEASLAQHRVSERRRRWGGDCRERFCSECGAPGWQHDTLHRVPHEDPVIAYLGFAVPLSSTVDGANAYSTIAGKVTLFSLAIA